MRGANEMSDEHILVCLSTSPTNKKVIESAARMAASHSAAFSALFVESTAFRRKASEAMIEQLNENRSFALRKGAQVETVYGDNIPFQIAEYAKLSGATMIIMGKSPEESFSLFHHEPLTDQVFAAATGIDLYVVPIKLHSSVSYHLRWMLRDSGSFRWRDLLLTAVLLTAATIVGILFTNAHMSDSNIIPFYILAVLIISVVTSGPLYGGGASVLSVFIFNYFFTAPRFSLLVIDSAYLITFAVMLAASLLTGSLASRLKSYAKHAAQNSYRSQILLETSQVLQQVSGTDAIAAATANQISKLTDRTVVVYLPGADGLREPQIYSATGAPDGARTYSVTGAPDSARTYSATGAPDSSCFGQTDREAAEWAWQNRKQAGAGTDTFPDARMLYLAIRIRDHAYGVVGIDESRRDMDPFLLSLLLSILGECALAMENEKNEREKEGAAEAAHTQKLRADLLRSISHDLRTPLTSIYGDASVLLSDENLEEEKKQQLYQDICDDSMWLIDVVQNLLSVTRLEDGKMELNRQAELMDEVIEEALKHIDRNSRTHHIFVDTGDDILMAKMDARLMVQLIVNLVNNAIKYTQPDSDIRIHAWKADGKIYVSVSDNGPGIADDQKAHVFEMFYTGTNRIADSRRSLGLGLALCRSIIRVHDGDITVMDNKPHGTVFTFSLPAEEVNIRNE